MPRTPGLVFPAMIVGLAVITATVTLAAAGDPQTGRTPQASAPTAIDPSTGLPLPPPPPWMDPEWPDPDKVLPEFDCDGLPVSDVARQLRQEFRDAFDVLIPNFWQDPIHPALSFNPQDITIRMQLKNVMASEVFNAMNLVFDTENTPCRWELKLNGRRPTAILRVLPERLTIVEPPPQHAILRMVYFVGDLVGDKQSGRMSMEQLVQTVSEVFQMSYGQSKGVIQFHEEAQLLIATGTQDQIQFVQETLSALREKPRVEMNPPPKPADSRPRIEPLKPL